MTQEYLRQMSLVVSSDTQAVDFGQFWVTFNVKRGDFQTPNSLDARIYNVKPATANLISKNEFTSVTLSAGYPGNVGLLFTGSIVQFRQGRVNQMDSYVDITAADGDQSYNYATMSATAPAGTNPEGLSNIILSSMQEKAGNQPITKGFQPTFNPNGTVRGRVMYGLARDEVRDFALQNNCKWSIQDGKLTFIPWTSFIPGGEIPVISVSTGLIGVPEQTQAGINIRILLNSSIKVGQLIYLDSQINQFRFALDFPSQTTNGGIDPVTGLPFGLLGQIQTDQKGLYYVMVANHTGDTRGQNWYTDMVCLSVDATLVNIPQGGKLFATAPVSTNTAGAIQRFGGT